MKSSSNGNLSDGKLKKRLMENGDCPSSSRPPVKFKRRKVSAIRDFPPGCGPNAPPRVCSKSPESTEPLVVPEKVGDAPHADDPKNTEIAFESELYTDRRSPTEQEMADSLDNLVEQVVASAGIFTGVENLTSTLLELPNKGLQNTGIELLKETNPILEICGTVNEEVEKSILAPDFPSSDADILEGNRPKNKYRHRRVSAIREFPPFCGSNAPQPSGQDRIRIRGNVEDGNVHQSEEKDTVADGNVGDGEGKSEEKELVLSTEIVRTGEMEEEGNIPDDNVEKSESKEIVLRSEKEIHTTRKDDGDEEEEVEEGKKSKSKPDRKKKIKKKRINNVETAAENTGMEIVLYSPPEKSHDKGQSQIQSNTIVSGSDVDRVVVVSLMAAPNCPWRKQRGAAASPDTATSKSKKPKKKSTPSKGKTPMKEQALVVKKDEDFAADNEEQNEGSPPTNGDSPSVQRPRDFNVSLPPFGPNSSSHGDARNRVREVLRLFQAIVRKLLQGEEAKLSQGDESTKSKPPRIDLLAAKIVRDKGKEVNNGKQILGSIPGVEIGDEFQYRVELAIVGIHRLYQGGIDYIKQGKELVAVSIVASGGYADDVNSPDTLIYSGQGGIPSGKDKLPEDQKLERGNLALKNSITVKNPVRVVRGSKEANSDSKGKLVPTYVYDGLYTVERYWQEVGPHGKLVFKFELKRVPGQPELALKEVKKSKKVKLREGLCVDDISGGKELFPICAINTIDDEKLPSFTYITSMIFPDHYSPVPPKGCDCIGGCVDSHKCSCAVNNGGELPYNYNGAIVEAKPLVYECGPSCKCSVSCHNRVSQHGIKIQLEIFKTESRGWGVRSINSISSGSFICEYIGELLDDREAEQRTGNDEYLFDIGQNYSDCSLGPDNSQANSSEVFEEGGYTIDAVEFGNIGRFINHSCSPNLYAQNVIYDNEDKRIPHIMFFAAENIPPLQELTYHYNYSVDQVRDSNGNIKKKSCYCGSAECTGRLY